MNIGGNWKLLPQAINTCVKEKTNGDFSKEKLYSKGLLKKAKGTICKKSMWNAALLFAHEICKHLPKSKDR